MRTMFAALAAALLVVGTLYAQAPPPAPRVVASGLESPWEVTWGPDNWLWVTERVGKRIVRINPVDGTRAVATTIPDVSVTFSQDGLLGLALHPDLLKNTGNDFVYVAMTYDDDPGTAVRQRLGVRRYRFDRASGQLSQPTELLRDLPAHDDHVGGRLALGPDRMLYLTVGDLGANFARNRCNPNFAQRLPTLAEVGKRDYTAYAGKILRLALDGSIPEDNPGLAGVQSHVFSYGHRNPLGLSFGPNGRLYESEHGPSSDDEVNLIQGGRNYGWPNVAGFRDDKVYVYSNWSASAPTACGALPPGGPPPASVPSSKESAFTDVRFTPPLATFFTVDSESAISGSGSATIAPGGLAATADALYVLSLIRGTVFRLALGPDGRTTGEPVAMWKTANRYRDIAISPDGRTAFLATDNSGPYRDEAGVTTQKLANPGSILAFPISGQ
jgi:PQQ-dependent dehydrogenase (s-GDH family)